jgi:hypothetical protein
MIVGGSNNFINEESEAVTLIGSEDVRLNDTVENFLGVGLDSTSEIQSNSVNFFDVFRVSDSGVTIKEKWLTVTSDFTVDGSYSGYYIDASSGDITMTVDVALTDDRPYNIIRIDSSINRVYIDATSVYGTENFIGNALPYDLGLIQHEALPLITNLDTIRIKG